MGDLFIDALDELAGDPACYLYHIPRDIIGIIRGMRPREISSAKVARCLSEMYRWIRYEDMQSCHSLMAILLWTDDMRDVLHAMEAKSAHPISWWVTQLNCWDAREVKQRCIECRGEAFWMSVQEARGLQLSHTNFKVVHNIR